MRYIDKIYIRSLERDNKRIRDELADCRRVIATLEADNVVLKSMIERLIEATSMLAYDPSYDEKQRYNAIVKEYNSYKNE